MSYAIVGRYNDHERGLITACVYSGFPTRQEANEYNDNHFPSPEYNLILPVSWLGGDN